MSRNRPDDDREARLAEALRANLRRRKAQTRTRNDGRADPPTDAGGGAPGADTARGDDQAPSPPSGRR